MTARRICQRSRLRMANLVVCMVVLCGAGRAIAEELPPADRVHEANKLYAAGDYDKALETYKLAEVDCPECPEIAYDEGLVRYRQRDFEGARKLFNQALSTKDLDIEAKAKFNLGNVAYSQALEKMSNLQEAIEQARLAIAHYRDALDVNPQDNDARANIETAQLLIKDLLDKQKQQQENQQQQDQQNQDQQKQDQQQQQDEQQQDQKQQGEQDQQKEDEQQSEEQQQQQEGEQSQEQQSEQQQSEQQQQQDGDQADEQQQEEQQAAPREARELTEEEAARLLQAVRDKEAQRREELAERRRARRAPVTRDW